MLKEEKNILLLIIVTFVVISLFISLDINRTEEDYLANEEEYEEYYEEEYEEYYEEEEECKKSMLEDWYYNFIDEFNTFGMNNFNHKWNVCINDYDEIYMDEDICLIELIDNELGLAIKSSVVDIREPEYIVVINKDGDAENEKLFKWMGVLSSAVHYFEPELSREQIADKLNVLFEETGDKIRNNERSISSTYFDENFYMKLFFTLDYNGNIDDSYFKIADAEREFLNYSHSDVLSDFQEIHGWEKENKDSSLMTDSTKNILKPGNEIGVIESYQVSFMDESYELYLNVVGKEHTDLSVLEFKEKCRYYSQDLITNIIEQTSLDDHLIKVKDQSDNIHYLVILDDRLYYMENPVEYMITYHSQDYENNLEETTKYFENLKDFNINNSMILLQIMEEENKNKQIELIELWLMNNDDYSLNDQKLLLWDYLYYNYYLNEEYDKAIYASGCSSDGGDDDSAYHMKNTAYCKFELGEVLIPIELLSIDEYFRQDIEIILDQGVKKTLSIYNEKVIENEKECSLYINDVLSEIINN